MMTREEAIKVLENERDNHINGNGVIYESRTEALNMAIKALEQEPNCPYYVIDEDGHGLCKNHSGLHLSQRFKDWQFIQEPKTGHWIRMKAYEKWGCSECNTVFRFTFKEHYYCPNCGAKMVEPHESEVTDKE